MTTALQIFNRLKSIDVLLSAQVAMEETASEATAAQRLQLSQGLKSDDTEMPDYSLRSVIQYNKPPGPIRLYDTGDFYQGILIDVRGDLFVMESADEKSQMLQNRYGSEILGLGTQARIDWIKSLRPVFVGEIKKYLQ